MVCDDIPMRQLHSPAVEVVNRDVFALGRMAAEMFLGMVEKTRTDSPMLPTVYERGVVIPAPPGD